MFSKIDFCKDLNNLLDILECVKDKKKRNEELISILNKEIIKHNEMISGLEKNIK